MQHILRNLKLSIVFEKQWGKKMEQLLKKTIKETRQKAQKRFKDLNSPPENNNKYMLYGFTGIMISTFMLYQLKRQRSQQLDVQTLMSTIYKSQCDTIRINLLPKQFENYINHQGRIETREKEYKSAKAYTNINGKNYYTFIQDLDQFQQEIYKIQEFKTFKTKIITQQVSNLDQTVKVYIKLLARICGPLLLPFLLFNSSMGKIFKTKVLGAFQGIRPNIFFKDIAGLGGAKIEISEIVDFLQNSEKYKKIGAKVPKGALLSGPPGTGKTMLAKACAGEADVPFFSMSGSEFVELYAGMGASRVRDLFKNAKKQTPAIIFIDQIDAIGRKRQSKFGGANDERANTLNQLLVEMDGFTTSDDIIILAATNRIEMLDKALTRPGRFDRIVEIQLPDITGRQQILQLYLNKIKLCTNQTLKDYSKRISTLTFGFSGADLANLCNQAAILAVRSEKTCIEPNDFEEASDRVLAGLQQSLKLDDREKKKVAYHECGHAVVAWFLQGASPLLKITIIPRSKGSLGFAQYLPNESSLMTKEQLYDQLCVIVGGRTAQQHFFQEVTNGAADDLQKARKLAHSIIVSYGMSQIYPNYAPVATDGHNIFCQQTAKKIDIEIIRVINECTVKTRALISKYSNKIQALAEQVLKKQSLNHQQIKQILGERPFQIKENYKQFLSTSLAIKII